MGDRRNVIVKDDRGAGVSLYSHWGGTELPAKVQAALRKRWRWDDASYLARIIFCEMVKDEVEQETGYGISSADNMTEASKRDIIVDVPGNRVSYDMGAHWYSFEDVCTLNALASP